MGLCKISESIFIHFGLSIDGVIDIEGVGDASMAMEGIGDASGDDDTDGTGVLNTEDGDGIGENMAGEGDTDSIGDGDGGSPFVHGGPSKLQSRIRVITVKVQQETPPGRLAHPIPPHSPQMEGQHAIPAITPRAHVGSGSGSGAGGDGT